MIYSVFTCKVYIYLESDTFCFVRHSILLKLSVSSFVDITVKRSAAFKLFTNDIPNKKLLNVQKI